MKTVARTSPAEYVRPRLTEARIARMWSTIQATRARRWPSRSRIWLLGGALAAATCAVLALWLGTSVFSTGDALKTGDVVVTGAQSQRVTLPDGTRLSLGTATHVDLVRVGETEMRLRLTRGRLTCDVPTQPARCFVVEAGGTEVLVEGTRFTVELEPRQPDAPELSVSVERGRVQVRRDPDHIIATLEAGQQWSRRRAEPAEVEPEPSAASSATVAPAPPPARPTGPTAQVLMKRANRARVAGRPAEAARDYDRLRTRFPGDARAGLAAFELARIRLRSLNDPKGALEAFDFALQRNRGGFFTEDARAGRVEALATIGDAAACRAARGAFLERHPDSPHARRIKKLCPAR